MLLIVMMKLLLAVMNLKIILPQKATQLSKVVMKLF